MSERDKQRCGRGWAVERSGREILRWLVALLLVLPATAGAEDAPSAEETAAARALALEGIKLADAGRCDDAIEKLARAEKLHHAPVVLGRLGECQVARGQLVEGTETLRRVLREPLPPNPAPVLVKARERAQAVLERAKGRIGTLNIVIEGGPPNNAGVFVSVDGEAMNLALLEVDRPTDPGFHLVEAGAPGYLSMSARVGLTAGERQSVVIRLKPDPDAAPVAPEQAAEPSTAGAPAGEPEPPTLQGQGQLGAATADAAPPEEPDYTAAYVAWAAGGAGVVAGSVLGLMALSGKNELEEQCPANVCPESSRDRLDSARSASTAATISFALGGLGLGLGTFFYFNESAGSAPERTAGRRSEQALAPSWSARAWVGLGRVGVSGEF